MNGGRWWLPDAVAGMVDRRMRREQQMQEPVEAIWESDFGKRLFNVYTSERRGLYFSGRAIVVRQMLQAMLEAEDAQKEGSDRQGRAVLPVGESGGGGGGAGAGDGGGADAKASGEKDSGEEEDLASRLDRTRTAYFSALQEQVNSLRGERAGRAPAGTITTAPDVWGHRRGDRQSRE